MYSERLQPARCALASSLSLKSYGTRHLTTSVGLKLIIHTPIGGFTLLMRFRLGLCRNGFCSLTREGIPRARQLLTRCTVMPRRRANLVDPPRDSMSSESVMYAITHHVITHVKTL